MYVCRCVVERSYSRRVKVKLHSVTYISPFSNRADTSVCLARSAHRSIGAIANIDRNESMPDNAPLYSSERFNDSYRTPTLEAVPGVKWAAKRFK